MTRTEFIRLLKNCNIPETVVGFDDPIHEGFCIRKNYFRWEVFYRERWKEYNCIGFSSESDALEYVFEKIYHFYPTSTGFLWKTGAVEQSEDKKGQKDKDTVCVNPNEKDDF